MNGRTITTSGEYIGGPYDSLCPAVELDTNGAPPGILTPIAGDHWHPDGALMGGYYQVDGKTEAGRHRYVWVSARRGPRPEWKVPCCSTRGRGCPMWKPS